MSLEDRLYPALALYEKLPDWLQHGLGTAYRVLPRRLRLGARFSEFETLAAESEHWPPEQVREYQWRQLRQVLIQAESYCPFYQLRFAAARFQPATMRDWSDFHACPLLEKRELIEHLPEFVSSAWPRRARLYITTGGSTGVPVGFYLQRGVSRPKEQAFLEAQWGRAGYAPGMRVAVIRGHTLSASARGAIARYDATRNWLLLSSAHLTRERLPDYLAAIERFQPEILHAYPSAALQLAGFLEASGQQWRTPLRALLAGSERLTLPQKRLLERAFRCRVFRWYGHSERVVLAAEGRASELFHFWPSYGFVEFGPPDAEGLREIIGTSFHNLVMPLVRYRTGDYARVVEPAAAADPAAAAAEVHWPAVSEIAGRSQEFLVSAGGRRISLTAFNMHDGIFDDLYAVQFFQEAPGVAEFRYVPSPRFQESRLPQIHAGIQRKLGDDFRIECRAVGDTEKTARGKHRWLVSRLDSEAEMT
jgi:phenylacetate-CoA ligase